jgi:hypothetical protein
VLSTPCGILPRYRTGTHRVFYAELPEGFTVESLATYLHNGGLPKPVATALSHPLFAAGFENLALLGELEESELVPTWHFSLLKEPSIECQ